MVTRCTVLLRKYHLTLLRLPPRRLRMTLYIVRQNLFLETIGQETNTECMTRTRGLSTLLNSACAIRDMQSFPVARGRSSPYLPSYKRALALQRLNPRVQVANHIRTSSNIANSNKKKVKDVIMHQLPTGLYPGAASSCCVGEPISVPCEMGEIWVTGQRPANLHSGVLGSERREGAQPCSL